MDAIGVVDLTTLLSCGVEGKDLLNLLMAPLDASSAAGRVRLGVENLTASAGVLREGRADISSHLSIIDNNVCT